MLGFVNTYKAKDRKEFDLRKEQKRKKITFNIIFGILSFALLNIILYWLTRI